MTVGGLQKIFLDQVRDHFGVGFGGELVALFNQLALQRNVVLDDAVVHDDDSPGAVAMGMRVFFRGPAMGGPAGVADAVGAIERLEADDLFQVAQLALGAANLQTFAIAAHCDSGGIVAAIFQPSKSLDDDRYHPFLANISHDAAHANAPIFGPGETEDVSCELEIAATTSERLPARSATTPAAAGNLSPPPNRGSRLLVITLRGRNETLRSPDWSGRRGRCGSLPPRLRFGSGRHRG